MKTCRAVFTSFRLISTVLPSSITKEASARSATCSRFTTAPRLHGKNLESSSQTSGGSAAPQPAAVPSEPSYKHYVNRRYGFQVDYPADFIPGRQPANGDGLSFTSPDGQASLNVSAGHIFNTSLQKAYTNDLQRVQGSLGYHTAGDTWYVITWSDARMIHYQKTFILGKTRDDMRFSYPIQQKGSYENVVSALESSFKSGRDD